MSIHNNIHYNIAFNLRNEATQEVIKKDTRNERITKTYEAMAPLNEIGPLKAANQLEEGFEPEDDYDEYNGEPIAETDVPL